MTNPTDERLERADPLVRLFRDWLQGEHKSKATIDHYIGATIDYFQWGRARGRSADPAAVTKGDVMSWLASLWERVEAGEYKEASVRNRFVGFRRFMRWLIEEEFVPRGHADPFHKIAIPQVPEVFKELVTEDEVAAMLDYLEARKRYRDAALVSLLYDTGLRAAEALTLRWSDFRDRSYRRAIIGTEAGRRTKGRTLREVSLGMSTAARLIRWRRQAEPASEGDWVFPARHGGPMNVESAHKLMKTIARNAGIERVVGVHVFRHTWACNMLRAGVTPQDLKNLGGWSDLSMVEHYTKMVEREVALERAQHISPVDMLRGRRADAARGM